MEPVWHICWMPDLPAATSWGTAGMHGLTWLCTGKRRPSTTSVASASASMFARLPSGK